MIAACEPNPISKCGSGSGPKRPWTIDDLITLRELYGRKTAKQLGRQLGRSASAVMLKANALGLSRRYGAPAGLLDFIRQQHAAGYLDTDIHSQWMANHGQLYPVDRKSIRNYRAGLGLPVNSERRLQRRRDAHRKQLETMGIASLQVLAVRRQRRAALQSGWPLDLSPLEVRIMDALQDGQFRTRREIAEAIGARCEKQRTWFKCRRGTKTALGNLVVRGLVRRTAGRTRKGHGKGATAYEYWIPLDVLRNRKRRSLSV